MNNDPKKTFFIGLFVSTAVAIIIGTLFFLHPTVGDDAITLRVRFANIDKVSKGTRVTYGGKPVGEVIEVRDIETNQEGRKAAKDGFVYIYELVLGVDSKVRVYNTDQISLRTSGLLGEKSVEITPQPPKPGQQPELVMEDVLFANETGSVEETLKEFKELADKIESTLDSFKFAIDELNRSKIWERLGHMAQNVDDITTALNKPDKWEETLNNIHSFTKKLNASWDHIDQAAISVNDTLKSAQVILDTIHAGKGTVGALIMRDDLYLHATSLMNKGELLMDDIGHYGLLFQNDKRWQRLRARRTNLLARLSCPQEFRNYFNDEVDDITTSLSRLSQVLYEVECLDPYGEFMDDLCFRAAFAELLRRVNSMQESLKLYNQQVAEREAVQILCPCSCEE